MQSRHLNCTLMSYIHFFTCALFIACFCPQLDPHHPPGKHCGVFFFFFVSGVSMVFAAHLTWAQDQCGICCWSWWLIEPLWQEIYVKTWTFQWIKVSSFFFPSRHWDGLYVYLQTVINCVCLWGCYMVRSIFFPSIFTSLQIPPSLPPSIPFGADVLLFLYPPTCFTHMHTCSLSLTKLHFGLERENYWWKGIALFLITLCALISSPSYPAFLLHILHAALY